MSYISSMVLIHYRCFCSLFFLFKMTIKNKKDISIFFAFFDTKLNRPLSVDMLQLSYPDFEYITIS